MSESETDAFQKRADLLREVRLFLCPDRSPQYIFGRGRGTFRNLKFFIFFSEKTGCHSVQTKERAAFRKIRVRKMCGHCLSTGAEGELDFFQNFSERYLPL